MSDILRPLADRFAGAIAPFAPAGGPPPRQLGAFFRWCLSGAWGPLVAAFAVSALAGTTEIATAFFLGAVIDSAADPSAGYFARNALLLGAFLAFYVVLRPLIFGTSAAFNGIAVAPNVYPLVQSRLHRWSLGQSVTFFDDDFAGRIATKQMQTARAVTEVTSEFINVVAFASSSLIGSAVLMLAIDWRIALALTVWLAGYATLFAWFMPRIRARSKARAAARAMVTGQVVDTITNIKTVKLFGHADHEDRAALDAMERLRGEALGFGRMSTAFRFCLMFCAGLLPIVMIVGTLMLWRSGAASPGDIATAGAISFRLSQMTGWVSFTLMAMYANVGEVEDGMNTLAHPHRLTDAPDAADLPALRGDIRFEGVTFTYGREDGGGVEALDLRIRPAEKLGVVGASGAGKSTLVALLLRLYDPEAGRVTVDGRDLRTVTQDSLRRQIGMVTQETAMFNRSARENIRYGRPDATDAEVEAAARAAEAHAFIAGLRDHRGRTGYDAALGERGREAVGRAAPAHRARARHPEGRPRPGAGRGHERAGQRGGGRDPGRAGAGDGRQDRHRHRAPPQHHRAHGPHRRHGGRAHRRDRHPCRAAARGRHLCPLLEPSVGRISSASRTWRPSDGRLRRHPPPGPPRRRHGRRAGLRAPRTARRGRRGRRRRRPHRRAAHPDPLPRPGRPALPAFPPLRRMRAPARVRRFRRPLEGRAGRGRAARGRCGADGRRPPYLAPRQPQAGRAEGAQDEEGRDGGAARGGGRTTWWPSRIAACCIPTSWPPCPRWNG